MVGTAGGHARELSRAADGAPGARVPVHVAVAGAEVAVVEPLDGLAGALEELSPAMERAVGRLEGSAALATVHRAWTSEGPHRVEQHPRPDSV